MAFWKGQIYGDSKKISGYQGVRGGEEMTRQSTEDF